MRTVADLPRLSGAGLMGYLNEYRADPRKTFLRFTAECGDLGKIRLATLSLVVANSPALVEDLLVRNAKHTRKSRLLRTALYPLGGEGLFTSEGELWRRQRRLMAPLFQPHPVSAYGPAMTHAATRTVERWRDGEVIDLTREATRITMSIAGRTLFDIDVFEEADEIGEALTEALVWAAKSAESPPLLAQVELAGALDRAGYRLPGGIGRSLSSLASRLDAPVLLPTERNRRLKKAIALLEARVQRMIAERQSSPASAQRSDVLSRLLQTREEDGGAMSERQVRDEILTLFVAGHETTATALTWAFHLLGQHPEIRAKATAEVDALGGTAPRVEDLARLDLCQRIFKEALRLYPPVPFYEREATEPFELGDVHIPHGTYVVVFPFAVHHLEAYWPSPQRFDPDRFLPEAERARPRHAWIPFGAGSRVCIGNGFALLEGTLVLATLLQRASFEPLTRDVQVDPAAATFRPLGKVEMRVRLRTSEVAAASA